MITAVVLFFALFIGAAWGAAENRLWKEHGDGVSMAHTHGGTSLQLYSSYWV
jgi:hypothetical protein